MKNILLKVLSVILLAVMIFSVFAVGASAESYDSYTYWDEISLTGRKNVKNRTMYECKKVFRARDIGVESIEELTDICIDDNGYTYLLDMKKGIFILDNELKLVNVINSVNGEKVLTFTDAKSIYIDEKLQIYICDTQNKRVIVCDSNGTYITTYSLPNSPLIPEKFDFKPIRVIVDSKGFVYVLSEGSYYGALLYSPDKTFMGFYGSNTVANGIIGGIQSLIKRMFPNNKKQSNSQRSLPYCFTDIVIDDNDFVYTATDSANKGQIKKLNPGQGTDILDSSKMNFSDDKVNRTLLKGKAFSQKITGLDVDKNGFIFALDSTYGRIFVYDSQGRMITAFGGGMGSGTQKGTFITASAIAVNDDNEVLICDKTNNTLTVFQCNEYGKEVLRLTNLTNKGDYTEAKDGWEKILKIDKNLQIAYTGLARAYLADEDYKDAMDISLKGYDKKTYALSFEYYRTEWLLNNFKFIFIFALLLVAATCFCFGFVKKKKIKIIKNQKLSLISDVSIHPEAAFEKIKDKQEGSLIISFVLVLLFYVSTVIKTILGGFMFTGYDLSTYNSLWVLVQSAGIIVLWSVANWLVCSLSGGKGKLKEIIIVTSYSLTPVIIGQLLWTVFSNFVLPTESAVLGIISGVSILYTLLLLTIGMIRIHEFTMTKFFGTAFFTVIGMASIVFLIILVGILLQQLGGFISTLLIEIFL